MMNLSENFLESYNVSTEFGFLMIKPLEYLPEYFKSWNSLAKDMPDLVKKKQLREAVHEMDLLDFKKLDGHRQYRLAHLQLSIIASGYIWQEGDSGAAKVLPKNVSIPWCGVSEYLDLQPVLSHASLVLANWGYTGEGSSVRSLYRIPGGSDAEWFITVTTKTELAFAAGLQNLMQVLYHAEHGNIQELTKCLTEATQTVHNMKKVVSTMHENLSAETFYDVMRPFLTGWGGDGSPLPDGIIYEGVSDKPRKMTGGSAAQSSTLQCIDAVLGVKHSQGNRDFLMNMRNYMPPSHREFLYTIERQSKVKSTVESSNCDKLTEAYNQCVKAVVNFRSYHIQIVTKYIVLMANRESRNKDYESLATMGTGGSSILPFLKSLRTTTSACLKDTET
ncbi:myoglobin-like [Ruditapes philippinarum]|uniref:myoglobin-like n=1 Tax=Ruditapes philippinarum TaxID=129788 RepID=UPI00295A7A6F|nr:myoglobin-like [Ruditapes philippinarum]